MIMRRDKQKKEDSQDEFQHIEEQVETINTRQIDSPPKITVKSHPRMHYLAEKYRIGLVSPPQQMQEVNRVANRKEAPVGIGKIIKVGSATFRSNFQCGSIGGVELVGSNSFKITLVNEANSSRGNNWFDFMVDGIKGEATFIITGFRKRSSLYNQGMKVCYREHGEKWKRGGAHIRYQRQASQDEGKKFEIRFTFSFKMTEHYSVEFAYCFPYGLSKLHQLLAILHARTKIQTIASSFEGIDLPLINIGNLSSKEVIILSARVHPGETVSSFIMEGFLKEIVSDSEPARFLRERFLFKIMPMINVDGVRHGNFRFCASGVDLNRRWKQPSEQHHPQIYYLKQMILRESRQKRVRMFIDMHGHSCKKNVFFYGCCPDNQSLVNNFYPKAFPFLMSKIHDAYSYTDCSFIMQEDKQGTARVSLWNQLKINEIYTLEASFCSSNKGQNYHESDYLQMGHKLCEGIALYFYQPSSSSSQKQSHLAKAVLFREKVFNQLRNDPSLLKLGNEQNSGSDSEPEKGEHHQKQKQKIEINIREPQTSAKSRNSSNNIQQVNKRQQQNRKRKASQHVRQITNQESTNLIVPFPQQCTIKHKSDTDIYDNKIEIQPQNLNKLFPPLKSLRTDPNKQKSTQQKKTIQNNKNIRVHHAVKGNSVPITKLTLYTDQQPLNQEEQKKDKRAISAFENTQYRRIKNMFEQRFIEKKQEQTQKTLVQSINHRKIQVQPSQAIVPRFYNTPMRKRKNSGQNFYSKASKSVGKAANVMCFGRQIML